MIKGYRPVQCRCPLVSFKIQTGELFDYQGYIASLSQS